MAVENFLLSIVARADQFCMEYWDVVLCMVVGLLTIIAMLIISNKGNKHLK